MVDRQRKLEEALLFSGQFKDAMQALLDWLYKVEPLLAEDQPVHGDLDTVNSLEEEHRVSCLTTVIRHKMYPRITGMMKYSRKVSKRLSCVHN